MTSPMHHWDMAVIKDLLYSVRDCEVCEPLLQKDGFTGAEMLPDYDMVDHRHCCWCPIRLTDGSNRCDPHFAGEQVGHAVTALTLAMWPENRSLVRVKGMGLTTTFDPPTAIEKVRAW